jgi:hypothetical protein
MTNQPLKTNAVAALIFRTRLGSRLVLVPTTKTFPLSCRVLESDKWIFDKKRIEGALGRQ